MIIEKQTSPLIVESRPKVVLFCKSFSEDVHRIRRLLESIQLFNEDDIPTYVSVPTKELELFKENISDLPCHLLTDEEILEKGIEINGPPPKNYSRLILQQIVKMEFWRMGYCQNFFWIDSDSYFIRPFRESDFFNDDGRIYNVQYEDSDLFCFAKKNGYKKIISDYKKVAQEFKDIFNRDGPYYIFGPSPLMWSCEVIKGLNEDFLSKQGNIYDFFKKYSCEINLYAEYLISSNKVPFVLRKPFFKVFHYPEQFYESQYLGEWDFSLAKNYMGIVIQSNWAKPDFKEMNKKTFSTKIKNLIGIR